MKKIFTFIAAAFVAMTMNATVMTVAEAYQYGMSLDSAAVSPDSVTVEGYVINAGSFSMKYYNQSWYMADEATATESDFEAYNCYPIQGNDTLKVLNGDKVSITGKLKKFWNRSASKFIIEFEKANATFITMAPGDHSVVNVIEEATVAQALTIGAALADNASTEKQYKITGYVSAVNVKSSDAYSEQYGNQSFWVADAKGSTAQTNADGAFYVYRGKPDTEEAIPYGALVEFTCTIKKYVAAGGGDPVIENTDQNIVVKVLAIPEVDTLKANVAEAMAIGMALEDNAETEDIYAVYGYVASIKGEPTAAGKQTFYLADDASAERGDFTAYLCTVPEGGVQQGDYVRVIGKIIKYVGQSGTPTIEISGGATEMDPEPYQGIEEVVLTKDAQKVMVDGVMYIVRDNKMYNVQGTQVR